ncbi:MAG: LysR family transcriptional regulator [bacterium]|nr:LysR family transcriptional regulator [bacterium]
MNISQPAVTHQIQSLENELNAKLFRRTTRTVELTAEGLTFLYDARDIVALSRRALKRFESADKREFIDFPIGCTSQAQFRIFSEVLIKLKAIYPNLHPKIFTVPSVQILKRVEEGTVDITIGLKTNIKKASINYQELKKVPAICVFHKDHPFAGKASVTMEDIKQQNLILYHTGSVSMEIAHIQGKLSESKQLSDLYFCESEEAALLLAEAGFGVAILPDIFISDDSDKIKNLDNLIKRRIDDAGELSFGYYYRTLTGNPLLKDFIKLLKTVVTTGNTQKNT